jgi:superkiller protein 3
MEKGAGRLPEACRSAIDLVEIAQVTGARVDAVEHARRLIAELHAKGVGAAPRSHLGFLGLGFASMIAGRPDQALGHFDNAAAAAPRNPEVLRWKGSALREQRRVDEALAVFDEVIVLDPDSAEAHHDRGLALAMLREFGPAVEAFDQALALDPNHVASLSDKGKYAAEMGRHEEALKALRRAAALVPDHPAPWLNKGLTEEILGRDEDALSSYERFLACAKPEMRLQIEASKRKVEQLRARVAARSGLPPLAPLPAAAQASPRATQASIAAVKNLLAEDDLDEAEIERLAVALDRGDQGPIQAALKRGNERMAAQVAAWVLPDPTVPAVVPTASFEDCVKRAEMARNQGLFPKALEWADQAIASDSKKHQGWLTKADALFGLRRPAEAAANARRATELQPGLPPAWIRLASSLDLLNAPDQALPAWEKAVELAGQNVLAWNGKGVCLAKLGRIEEALAAHEKSLAIDPRFSLGKFHKGMIEAALGRKEAALKSLQQFLALAPPHLAGLAQEARQRMQELKI